MTKHEFKVSGYAFNTDPGALGGSPSGTLFGVAADYGVDRGGDMILPGAFEKSLRANPQVPMKAGHEANVPVGRWTDMVEDRGMGLLVKGTINGRTTEGKDTMALIERGDLDGLSIEYLPTVSYRSERGGKSVRVLAEVELVAIALVGVPMQPAAKLGGAGRPLQRIKDLLHIKSLAGKRKLTVPEMKSLVAAEERVLNTDVYRAREAFKARHRATWQVREYLRSEGVAPGLADTMSDAEALGQMDLHIDWLGNRVAQEAAAGKAHERKSTEEFVIPVDPHADGDGQVFSCPKCHQQHFLSYERIQSGRTELPCSTSDGQPNVFADFSTR